MRFCFVLFFFSEANKADDHSRSTFDYFFIGIVIRQPTNETCDFCPDRHGRQQAHQVALHKLTWNGQEFLATYCRHLAVSLKISPFTAPDIFFQNTSHFQTSQKLHVLSLCFSFLCFLCFFSFSSSPTLLFFLFSLLLFFSFFRFLSVLASSSAFSSPPPGPS